MLVMSCFLVSSTPVAAENYDYFTAAQDPARRPYLQMVEEYHTKKVLPHLAAGQIDYAINELRYTLNAIPNHPRALMLIKPLENAAKNTAFGVIYFERAIKLYPQYAITHAQYGWYLVERDLLDAGIMKLKQAIEMDAKLVSAYVWLSRAYKKKGDPELARQAAEEARKLGYSG